MQNYYFQNNLKNPKNLKPKIYNLKPVEGFTVIEMLVSSGIVAILTIIFLANYHGLDYRAELIMETQKAVSNLNLSRSFSLSSKKYDNKVSEGGWGVHFSLTDSSGYSIFADKNNNKKYDIGEVDVSKGGRVISLSNKVAINNINACPNGVCNNQSAFADIIFIQPDPTVFINTASSTSSYVEIKFIEKGGHTIKTVKINSLGLSEVID